MMNEDLVASLQALRSDPAIVVTLYRQLFDATLIVLVDDARVNLQDIGFLAYPTGDRTHEIPVFTSPERPLLRRLESENGATRLEIKGHDLWSRLLDLVVSDDCEVAADPGEPHSIAINRELLLGIVKTRGIVA
jgi:hypothetical protein